jgi:FdhD protein
LTIREADTVKINLRTGTMEKKTEQVAMETPINLYINKEHITTILASPGNMRELAVGFLVDEGIIPTTDEIENVVVRGSDVKIQTTKDVKLRLKAYGMTRLVTTACGSIEAFIRLLDRMEKPQVTSNLKIPPHAILQMVRELNKQALIFKATGGTHSAAVFTSEGVCVSFTEDVGRHTATDKALGAALLAKADLPNCILTCTGRLSGDIVLKAARIGVPIIASIAGPLYSGVYAAEKTQITLVAFVRGQRMNIYTRPERISWPTEAETRPL